MSHERASFGAALRDAAESFTVPPTERIHERALRRGRQIKRRRMAGTLSVAAAVAAVGVLTASLLSPGAPTRPPVESATGTHTAATMTRTQLGVYMAVHLRELLPPGAEANSITIPLYSGDGYSVQAPTGAWAATAYVIVSDGGKRYTVSVDVIRGALKQTCAMHPSTDVCTSKSLGHGTLVSDGSMTTPGKMASGWYYYWDLAGGASVQLIVNPYYSANPPPLFTQQQAEAFVAAPAWTSVLNGLPQIVHCDDLKMSEHGIASEWTCQSTGKVYPGPWMVALAD